jgi:hypothetical protein
LLWWKVGGPKEGDAGELPRILVKLNFRNVMGLVETKLTTNKPKIRQTKNFRITFRADKTKHLSNELRERLVNGAVKVKAVEGKIRFIYKKGKNVPGGSRWRRGEAESHTKLASNHRVTLVVPHPCVLIPSILKSDTDLTDRIDRRDEPDQVVNDQGVAFPREELVGGQRTIPDRRSLMEEDNTIGILKIPILNPIFRSFHLGERRTGSIFVPF